MKKIMLLLGCLAIFLTTRAQVDFMALKISPEFPQANKPVSFEFDKTKSPLSKQTGLEIVVYQFGKDGPKAIEPALTKQGESYKGSFTLDSTANAIAFSVSSGAEKDLNGGKGFLVPVYTDKNIPVKEYYKSIADLQNGYGEYLLGITGDAKMGLEAVEEGRRQYPELRTNPFFLDAYLSAINHAKKKEAPGLILAELQSFEAKGNLTAEDYSTLISWYTRDNRKEKADSLAAASRAAFPAASKRSDAITQFQNEPDPGKKLALYKEFVRNYPEQAAKDNKFFINRFKLEIASAYAEAKDYKSYDEWSKNLDKVQLASSNNNLAWEMAEAGTDLETAKKMSYIASSYAKNEMLHPSGTKDPSITTKQWKEQRESTYGMYGDTYAFILYKLGDYKSGLPYAKEAATINKLQDPEYNERYALLAEKALPAMEAKKLIEQFVKEGTASSKTKGALKNLYIKEKKSDKGWVAYLDVLEASAKAKKREEIAKSILNDPSPQFSLTDFEGRSVSLNDLKGKVVVVDFWATWCGPCIASMPGMHKALEKYKDNENVKFLFVDTWENSEDKLKNAKDFMTTKKYPFHVLMDTENKMVEDFSVRGIPTKFILDKEGRIRFKAVGFSGNDDALVDELSTMIELASL